MRKKDFERALADAMDRNEFRLLYQPIISVSSGRITAFETLLRWDRPGHGTIVPDEFIPIAEERGLINDIGMWVLKEACSHAASWPAPISICVNFSPVQFMDAKLPGEVRRVLRAVKLDPRRLEVEVTENVLLEDPNRALAIFEKLRSLGVRISLDDFGTGFSSLSYFRQFPFDSVKIDKSFTKTICEPISLEIIRAVVDLGGKLDIRVIAEGVETSAQFDALRSLRCGSVQGYLLGKPMQYRDATAMIVRQASLERAA
jgi:EAL domain-containing protein (putative c-di-GMP-specific phosphodiesterase class I)